MVESSTIEVPLATFRCSGKGYCIGGERPPLPMERWPLLSWGVTHPVFGDAVFLCDQSTTVEQVAMEAASTPDYAVIATRFGTTADHVAQAIDYAAMVAIQ